MPLTIEPREIAARYDKAKARNAEVAGFIADGNARRRELELYFRKPRKREVHPFTETVPPGIAAEE